MNSVSHGGQLVLSKHGSHCIEYLSKRYLPTRIAFATIHKNLMYLSLSAFIWRMYAKTS